MFTNNNLQKPLLYPFLYLVFPFGRITKWLCGGLQIRIRGFKSLSALSFSTEINHKNFGLKHTNKRKVSYSLFFLILILLAFFVFISVLTAASSILINEVMASPIESDATHEWIELYNFGNKSINLSGWKITDNYATDYISPANLSIPPVIPPHTFVIITDKDTELTIPENESIIHFMVDDNTIGNGLGNTNDYLLLINENGTIADSIKWGLNYSIIPGETLPSPAKGSSFIRISPTRSNNSVLDFVETTIPTLGQTNIYTKTGTIQIQTAQEFLPKINKYEQYSIPFAINVTLTNFSENRSFQLKTYITSISSSRYPASQTWAGEKWQYSDRYTHNITTDKSGNWQGWIYLRFSKDYEAYKQNIQHNYTCSINVRIKDYDLTIDEFTTAYLLDFDNSTSNGSLGGYLIGNTKEKHMLFLKNETDALLSCYVSKPNNIDDFSAVINGYYKLSAPVGSNYTLYSMNNSGFLNSEEKNISIVHGIYYFDIKTNKSLFDLKNRKQFSSSILIKNTGTLTDTYLLSIADKVQGFNIILEKEKITLLPGQEQEVTVFITPTTHRLFELHYGKITIKVSSENDPVLQKIYTFSCKIHEPDLTIPQIKSYDMNGLETNTIYEGHVVRIKAFFKNNGTEKANHATVSYFFNEIEPDKILETINYDYVDKYQKYPSLYLDTHLVEPGKHIIYVVADYFDTVKELDEYNNVNSITLTILNTTPSLEEQQILITELYYYAYPNIRNEFITLFNPTNTSICLDDWYITNTINTRITKQKKISFLKNTFIAANSYITFTQNASDYQKQQMKLPNFEYAADSNSLIPKMNTTGTIFISNTGGAIALKNKFNHTIDSIIYGDTLLESESWGGPPIPSTVQGEILKRRKENNTYIDSNTAKDWISPYIYLIGQSSFSPNAYYVNVTITPFVSPDTSFSVISEFIQNTNSEILLSIYEFTSTELTNILIDALQRNVTLNMLVEGSPVGGMSEKQKFLLHRLHHHGANIHLLRGNQAERIYKRYRFTHAKYVVLDEETVIVHSGNFAPTGVPSVVSFGNREWGVALKNKTVAEFYATVFYDDWDIKREDTFYFSSDPIFEKENYLLPEETYYGIYRPILTQSPSFTTTAKIQPVLSPDNSLGKITNLLLQANKSIYIQQLYIYPNWTNAESPIIPILISKAEQGVDIRIILNYNPFYDSTNIQNDNTKSILEPHGIKIKYIYTNWSIFKNVHNKGAIIDNKSVLISSINWNDNSFMNNRETGVIIECENIAKYYADVFLYDWTLNVTFKKDNTIIKSETPVLETNNQNMIYIIVIYAFTFLIIAQDWRKRKWT
jgi:cardiolipin synthase A/B